MRQSLTQEQNDFLENLVVKYSDVLEKYGRLCVRYHPVHYGLVEDAVQETFIAASKAITTLMTHENVLGWLKVTLHRRMNSANRAGQENSYMPNQTVLRWSTANGYSRRLQLGSRKQRCKMLWRLSMQSLLRKNEQCSNCSFSMTTLRKKQHSIQAAPMMLCAGELPELEKN